MARTPLKQNRQVEEEMDELQVIPEEPAVLLDDDAADATESVVEALSEEEERRRKIHAIMVDIAAQKEVAAAADPTEPTPTETEQTYSEGTGDASGDSTSGENDKKADEPKEKEEEEYDEEKNLLFAACMAVAAKHGLSGQDQRDKAKELYETERKKIHPPSQQENSDQQKQEQQQPQNRGGGGFSLGIGSMLGSLFSKTSNSSKAAKESVAERILHMRAAQLEDNYHNMNNNIETLDKEVLALNKTFEQSLGGQALKEIADTNQIPLPQLIDDIEAGKTTSIQAKLAYENALANPEYKAQWETVEAARTNVKESVEKTGASFSKLHKSHGDRFDANSFGERFQSDLDKLNQGNKPIAGTDTNKNRAKEFEKQLEEMMERMRKIFERIFDKAISIFAKK